MTGVKILRISKQDEDGTVNIFKKKIYTTVFQLSSK